MNEFLRHALVFLPLFIILRWKFKRFVMPLFILLPFVGEAIQIIFPSAWEFQFEWSDMAVNYFTAGTGWAIMAAIRETQKNRVRAMRQMQMRVMGNKGFGLIEVMIGMFILGMGLMAATQLHYATSRNNRNGNVISIATMAATQTLESLRGQNIGDLVEGTFVEKVGLVDVSYVITKDPINDRLGRAVVSATLRGKTVRVETRLNNTWGKGSAMAIPIGG
jgi:prepilin-type N-terminal cleavage/methylation domain-containing protein